VTCVENNPVLSTDETPPEGFRLTIYLAGDMPLHIYGFNSIAEALEQGMEWTHRLWCSVWFDGVEVANEYPRERLDPSDSECTAYKHVIPWVEK